MRYTSKKYLPTIPSSFSAYLELGQRTARAPRHPGSRAVLPSRPANGATTKYTVSKITERQHYPSEHLMQSHVVQWCRYQYPARLILAIPNGGYRSFNTGKQLRDEGVLPGTPDLLLPEPVKHFAGLFIEMKQRKARPNDTQDALLLALRQRKYAAYWCDSFEDAQHLIVHYLKGAI